MCGIAGKLWLDPARPADTATVAAMTRALAHRGPDGEGLAADGPLALGHRRLAIVDLSERARQPFVRERRLLAVNGEIYNHFELRAELGAAGHAFVSDGDSEVVLPLYLEHWEREGPAFVERLEGMYAFALWDGVARRLVLARDRVGKKPLVYAWTKDALVFASGFQALKQDGSWDRTPDGEALSQLLAYRCIPHPLSAWRGARKLPPGHVLVVELEPVRANLQRTWTLAPGPEEGDWPDFDEAVDAVRDGLSRSVRRRLMADVPVGALLSGGLDSAAVVACLAEQSPGPISTFTIGFSEAEWDEAPAARRLARHFGTRHHEELLRPDAVESLGELVAHFGEPFADSSALATFLVARLASREVKVVLTGDGGDEAFLGYDRYRALALAATLDRAVAAPLRAGVRAGAALLRTLSASGFGAVGGLGEQRSTAGRLVRFERALELPPRARNDHWRRVEGDLLRDALLTEEGRELLPPAPPYGPQLPGPFGLNQAAALDVARYLPDDLLVKLDVATMAHGLEARCPFLDRELLQLAARLPAAHKLGRDGGRLTSKRVLRAAFARALPKDLRTGRKRGFGLPLDAWFRGPLLAHAREVLLGPEARRRGIFEPHAVEALLAAQAERRVAAHETLYTLLILERWFLQES